MTTVEAQDSLKRAPALRPRRLLGRDREITEVTESVRSSPVTTLIGPGGVGKTALATFDRRRFLGRERNPLDAPDDLGRSLNWCRSFGPCGVFSQVLQPARSVLQHTEQHVASGLLMCP
jgi:hypothetical protein